MEYPRWGRLSAAIGILTLFFLAAPSVVPSVVPGVAPGVGTAAAQFDDHPDQSWSHRYLPASDGVLGLRYGMNRSVVDSVLRGRGLKGRQASGRDQMRFEGEVLGEASEVLASFLSAGRSGGEDRLARIELRWRYDGALRAPRRIFEILEELLSQRYGEAVSTERGAWSSISLGDGRRGSVHVGPETEAVLEIRGVRKDLYRVELRLEFPPWAAQL